MVAEDDIIFGVLILVYLSLELMLGRHWVHTSALPVVGAFFFHFAYCNISAQ